jgi:hypothetical protein
LFIVSVSNTGFNDTGFPVFGREAGEIDSSKKRYLPMPEALNCGANV